MDEYQFQVVLEKLLRSVGLVHSY